jgi:hypothetical protein
MGKGMGGGIELKGRGGPAAFTSLIKKHKYSKHVEII